MLFLWESNLNTEIKGIIKQIEVTDNNDGIDFITTINNDPDCDDILSLNYDEQ